MNFSVLLSRRQQTQNEIEWRVHCVVVLLAAKSEKLREELLAARTREFDDARHRDVLRVQPRQNTKSPRNLKDFKGLMLLGCGDRI